MEERPYLRIDQRNLAQGSNGIRFSPDTRAEGEQSLERLGQVAEAKVKATFFRSTLKVDHLTDPRTPEVDLGFRKEDLEDPSKRAAIMNGVRSAIRDNFPRPDRVYAYMKVLNAINLRAARTAAILAVDPQRELAKAIREVLDSNWTPTKKA